MLIEYLPDGSEDDKFQVNTPLDSVLRRIIKLPPGDVMQRQLRAQSIPVSSLTSKVIVAICGPELTSIATLSISMLFKTGTARADPEIKANKIKINWSFICSPSLVIISENK